MGNVNRQRHNGIRGQASTRVLRDESRIVFRRYATNQMGKPILVPYWSA